MIELINKNIDDTIDYLELDKNIKEKLKENNINYVKDLWQLKRKDLKKIGLTDDEIRHTIIKLQLLSMDLNQKIYNKN